MKKSSILTVVLAFIALAFVACDNTAPKEVAPIVDSTKVTVDTTKAVTDSAAVVGTTTTATTGTVTK